MEVILRNAIENVGKPGDIVKVSNGYARNFLIPHGLAYEATAGNRKRIAMERERLEAAENERRLAGYDERLMRPMVMPRLVRLALRFLRRAKPAAAPREATR